MFKKSFKVSNSHAISSKDQKKLQAQLLKLKYAPEFAARIPEDIEVDKLVGSKVNIVSHQN
jgi:hypothetical protein